MTFTFHLLHDHPVFSIAPIDRNFNSPGGASPVCSRRFWAVGARCDQHMGCLGSNREERAMSPPAQSFWGSRLVPRLNPRHPGERSYRVLGVADRSVIRNSCSLLIAERSATMLRQNLTCPGPLSASSCRVSLGVATSKDNASTMPRILATCDDTLAAVESFMSSIGILPVVVRKESTGFIFNRIWRAVKKEALQVSETRWCVLPRVRQIMDYSNPIPPSWLTITGRSYGFCGYFPTASSFSSMPKPGRSGSSR